MYHHFLTIYLLKDFTGCFQFLATVNRAAVNIYVQIFGRHKFILILVNTKEYDCWIMW